jgi:hypothetical protein
MPGGDETSRSASRPAATGHTHMAASLRTYAGDTAATSPSDEDPPQRHDWRDD